MTLRDLIIQYREEHSISQRRFAAMCDLSNGYISMMERGENPKTKQPVTPTLPVLKKLASGMGMSLTDLFIAVDDMPVEMMLASSGNEKMSAPSFESGLVDAIDMEIAEAIINLSPEKKREALNYIRYLADSEGT